MGIFTGQMVYREQIQKKYGEPMLSELDNIYASFSTALKDVIKTQQSNVSDTIITNITNTVLNQIGTGSKYYDLSISEVTVENTTTETAVYTKTIAGGTLSSGKLLKINLQGLWERFLTGSTNATGSNLAVKVTFGGTVVISGNIATGLGRVNDQKRPHTLEIWVSEVETNTQRWIIYSNFGSGAIASATWFTAPYSLATSAWMSSTAKDTSADQALAILITHSQQDTTLKYVKQSVLVESVNASASTTPTVSATAGGTGYSSFAVGDILYADTTTSLAKRVVGSAGQILRSNGTNPAYSTLTIPDTVAVSTLLYASSANVLAALATANSGCLITSGTGVPSISSTLPTAVQDTITRLGVIATLLEASAVIRTSNDVSSYLQLGRYQAGDPYGYVSVSPTLTDIGLKFETRASDISSTKALITGAGAFQFSAGTETLPSISFLDDVDTGFWINAADTERLNFSAAGVGRLQFGASGIKIAAAREVAWASGAITSSVDVRLLRDGPALLALRNSMNPQEFRIYNSDGASIDEFVSLGFLNTANVFTIETEQAGGGVVRPIAFMGGSVGIGTTTFPSAGTSGLVFGDGTALSGMGLNTAGLYADNVGTTVEMFAIDELGAATQISPHGFKLFEPDDIEPYPWSYYSKNEYLGIEINVDICKLARLVQNLTGQQVIYHNNIGGTRDWVDHQEYNMRRQMESYERWEVTEPEDGQAKPPAPSLPQLKQPPLWLKKRLSAKGLLNVEKAKVLATALTAWKQERHL